MKNFSLSLATVLAFAPSAFAQATTTAAPRAAAAPAPAAPAAAAPAASTAAPAPAVEPTVVPAEPTTAAPAEPASPHSEPASVEPGPAAGPVAADPVPVEPVAATTAVAAPTPIEELPQDGWVIGGAAWDLSIPLGSTQEFAGNVSPGGFSLEARYIGLGRLSFGMFTGAHYMTAKDETTTVQGPVTISGTQVRSVASTPWLGRVHFSLMDVRTAAAQRRPVPYVAFGFGGARVLRTLDMGISGFSKESWHWAMAPEIGVQLPLNRAVFYLSSRFNYFVESGDGPEQMYLNVTLGAGFF